MSHLRRLGYHVTVEVLRPNEDWAELEDRQRWVLVGTLNKPFTLQVPHDRGVTPASAFLDPPDALRTGPMPSASRGPSKVSVSTTPGIGPPATDLASRRSTGTHSVFPPSPRVITRSTRVRLCERPLACAYCGRPRSSASTATRCSPGTTPRRCKCSGRECKRACFAPCFSSWPTILVGELSSLTYSTFPVAAHSQPRWISF